jgi:uncharacterized protein (DUF362 family)
MPNPTVILTQCSDYSRTEISRAIAAQFELLGGLEKFVTRGDTVLLKPNFIAPKPRRCATQTDPAVLLEVAALLKDFGARPFIGDSPAWSNVFACIKALEMEDALKKLSIPVRQLSKPKKCRIGTKNIEVGISSIALDANVIINMPKFKTHQQLLTTFAVKNMFGCVSGKRKAIWHFAKGKNADKFCKLLIEIYEFLNPALTIIDAVIAMDGPGPINGRARPLGWLLGGTDPFALEVICSKLVNIKPENIPIIKTAKKMGLNCPNTDEIEILGDSLPQNPCTDFKLPQLIPIRFSLPHVCKSICKQIFLLAKSGFSSPRRPDNTG